MLQGRSQICILLRGSSSNFPLSVFSFNTQEQNYFKIKLQKKNQEKTLNYNTLLPEYAI